MPLQQSYGYLRVQAPKAPPNQFGRPFPRRIYTKPNFDPACRTFTCGTPLPAAMGATRVTSSASLWKLACSRSLRFRRLKLHDVSVHKRTNPHLHLRHAAARCNGRQPGDQQPRQEGVGGGHAREGKPGNEEAAWGCRRRKFL